MDRIRAKALGPDNKSEGKKSGVRITSLRWTMAESHLITIEFEFSSNRWRRLLIFFSYHVSPLPNVIEFERRIVFRPGESDLRSLLPSQIAAVRIRFVRGARVTARK